MSLVPNSIDPLPREGGRKTTPESISASPCEGQTKGGEGPFPLKGIGFTGRGRRNTPLVSPLGGKNYQCSPDAFEGLSAPSPTAEEDGAGGPMRWHNCGTRYVVPWPWFPSRRGPTKIFSRWKHKDLYNEVSFS